MSFRGASKYSSHNIIFAEFFVKVKMTAHPKANVIFGKQRTRDDFIHINCSIVCKFYAESFLYYLLRLVRARLRDGLITLDVIRKIFEADDVITCEAQEAPSMKKISFMTTNSHFFLGSKH